MSAEEEMRQDPTALEAFVSSLADTNSLRHTTSVHGHTLQELTDELHAVIADVKVLKYRVGVLTDNQQLLLGRGNGRMLTQVATVATAVLWVELFRWLFGVELAK